MKTKLFFMFLIAVLFYSCSNEEKVIGLKEPIQHDDFFYSVSDYYKADDIAGQKPSGVFYIVTFVVENRAKRVNHPWENNIAYIVDENQKQYQNLPDKQSALNTIKPFNFKDKHVTGAGETEKTVFVFDVPKESKQPYLKFNGDYLMGDMFDGNQFKKARIKLF